MAAKSRYDKSPKISDTEGSKKPEVKDEKAKEKGGKPEGPGQQPAKGAKVVATPDEGEKKPPARGSVAPKSLAPTGNEESGIPVHARHAMERTEMHHRQMSEKSAMHHRHEQELMAHATGKED